jgi:hypothetical protein
MRAIFLFSVRVELVETISRAHALRRALRPGQGERNGEGAENEGARARPITGINKPVSASDLQDFAILRTKLI